VRGGALELEVEARVEIGRDLGEPALVAGRREHEAAHVVAARQRHDERGDTARRGLALDGDLGDATRGDELVAATSTWQVFAQSRGELGTRLAHAHRTAAAAGEGPGVQVGMDTPQVTPGLLRAVAGRAVAGTAVLGPAVDGGWWVLGLAVADAAPALTRVPMSRPDTGRATRAALAATGLRVRSAAVLRDVDTAADAGYVAATAPGTRFAAAWRQVVAA